MFGLGFMEIIVILVVVMVMVKPEDLPNFIKSVGNSYGELKNTVTEVKKIKDDFLELADTETVKDLPDALEEGE